MRLRTCRGSGHDRGVSDSLIPPNDPHRPKGAFARQMEKVAKLPVMAWYLVHVGRVVDPFLMRVTKGRFNTTGTDVLVVLTTTGRKSGLPRETPLAYFSDGDDVAFLPPVSGG